MHKIALTFMSFFLLNCASYGMNDDISVDENFQKSNELENTITDQIFLDSGKFDEIIKLKKIINDKINKFSNELSISYEKNDFNQKQTFLVSDNSNYKSKFNSEFFENFIKKNIYSIFQDFLEIKKIYNKNILSNEIKKIVYYL